MRCVLGAHCTLCIALDTVRTLHRVFLENAMVHLINSSVIGLSSVCSKKVDAQGALG